MESASVRPRLAQTIRSKASCGGADPCVCTIDDPAQFLMALPQAAAIVAYHDDGLSVIAGNTRFNRALEQGRVSPADILPNSAWAERIREFIASGKDNAFFETRREGKLGPEYHMCTIGRLHSQDPAQNLLLFTATDHTNERAIEKNLRRELLADGLTALPNRTGFGEEIDDRLRNGVWPDTAQFGIIAIDPSSPFSGGAILGDRLRMTGLAGDDGVFIRSMATRGAMGGLARASLEAVDVLDAAGFDIVLIETVGVGQDEVDVVQAAHTVVVISAPGLGDEIQAIKAGILEIADIHVVSKCDRSDANATITDLKGMLTLGVRAMEMHEGGWRVPVVPTSAEAGEGIDGLLAAIDDHGKHLADTVGLEERRRQILEMRVLKTAEDIIRKDFKGKRDKLSGLMKSLQDRTMDPHEAALKLLDRIKKD